MLDSQFWRLTYKNTCTFKIIHLGIHFRNTFFSALSSDDIRHLECWLLSSHYLVIIQDKITSLDGTFLISFSVLCAIEGPKLQMKLLLTDDA